MTLRLLFAHGWALDHTLWNRLVEALGDDAEGAVLHDAGYYGRPIPWPALDPAGRYLGVGQSLGALELLTQPPAPLAGLVAIDGFARYSHAPDFRRGVPRRVLERMAEWLDTDGVLPVDFVGRAGGVAPAETKDIAALVAGLKRLETLDGRSNTALPIWRIHADQDPIAPLAMADDSFAGMNVVKNHIRQATDHLSPTHDVEGCAALIRAALKALS